MARERVTYWEKWGGEEWDTIAAVVAAFNAAQDAYEVALIPTGDWSAGADLPRFLAALAGGEPPDLIGLESHQIVDVAAQGALLPLRRDVIDVGDLGHLDPRFGALGETAGGVYGLPVAADIVTLYVDLDAVAGTRLEAGVPGDIAEFDAGLAELTAGGRPGFVPVFPGWWPQAWPWFFGGAWYDAAGRFTPDRPANARAYEWVAAFRQGVGAAFPGPVNPVAGRDADPFRTGGVALLLDGDWLVPRLARHPARRWAPAPFPTVGGRGAAILVADVVGVPAGAHCPAGAAAFLRFAARPEQLEAIALGQGKIAPTRAWSPDLLARHRNPHLETLRTILDSATLFWDPRVPGWIAQLERIKGAFARIWAGDEAPHEILASLR